MLKILYLDKVFAMIDSYMATYVLVGFLLIFGLLLPILDKVPFIKDFISLRWTLVVIYSAMCLGVIIDFTHLDTSVRFAVVVGGIVLSAIFLLVRSLEKAAVHRWKIPVVSTKVSKGDLSGEISLSPNDIRESNNDNSSGDDKDN